MQLSAKNGELNDELSPIKSLHTVDPTVSGDFKTAAGACERPAIHMKMTRSCGEFSTTTSTAACLALPTERDDLKNCFEAQTLEKHCIIGHATKMNDLRAKVADREKPDAMAKTTL